MVRLVPVADADDPRLAPYREIRERDLVGRQGRFVAEGKVVLRVLFSSARFAAESALILDRRLDGMADVLAAAPEDLPVLVAPQQVLDAVAGFHVHRGVLAIGRRTEEDDAAALLATLPAEATVLVLVGIANHDNVGSIFRNAAAFEADAVLIDAGTCDPLYRKAIRVSVGACLSVPYARGSDADAIGRLLDDAGFVRFALSPSGSRDIAGVEPPPRAALFLGTEGEGLPGSVMAGMRTLRIQMSDRFDSLNVAAASAVALHRLGRFGRRARPG